MNNDEFKIVKCERLGYTPCYESKWRICVVGDKEELKHIWNGNHLYVRDGEDYIEVQLTRFDEETKENMEKLLSECKCVKDVCKLHINVYYD